MYNPCCLKPGNHTINVQGDPCCRVCSTILPTVSPPQLTRANSAAPAPSAPPRLTRMPSLHNAEEVQLHLSGQPVPRLASVAPNTPSTAHIYGDGGGSVPEGAVPIGTMGLNGPNVPINSFALLHSPPVAEIRAKLDEYRVKYKLTVFQQITLEQGRQVIRYFKVEPNGKHSEITDDI